MKLNRTLKLTKPIRQEIAQRVYRKWLSANPKPETPVAMGGDHLKKLNNWREQRDAIERQCINALETFNTVNQISELWPEILPFVPDYLVDPSKYFKLP